eukprot:jgi/Galph1/156/GphlegSOOS_G4947.1
MSGIGGSKTLRLSSRLVRLVKNKTDLSALNEQTTNSYGIYARRHFATGAKDQTVHHKQRLTWKDFREGRCNLDQWVNDNRHIGVYVVLSIYVVVGFTLKKVFGGKKKTKVTEVEQQEEATAKTE